MYGDDDPEDAWSASDPVLEQLANLIQRIRWIVDHLRQRTATDRELSDHGDRLAVDLETIRARVLARDLD